MHSFYLKTLLRHLDYQAKVDVAGTRRCANSDRIRAAKVLAGTRTRIRTFLAPEPIGSAAAFGCNFGKGDTFVLPG